jgi:hypothetical protein
VVCSVTGYPVDVSESSTGSRVQISVMLPAAASKSSRELIVDRNVTVSKWFTGRFCRFDASGWIVLTRVQWSVLRGA